MSSSPKVLYIEDDPLSRMVLEILLKEAMDLSYVAIFPDSTDFEKRLEALQFVPDIILLDIHVKPLNGFEMLEFLRQHPIFKDKPITALTASVMNEEIDQLRSAGFDGVLAKPIQEATFPNLLHQLLAGEQIWTVG